MPRRPAEAARAAPRRRYKKPYNGEFFKYTFLALVCERGVNAAIGLMGVMCLGGSGLKHLRGCEQLAR